MECMKEIPTRSQTAGDSQTICPYYPLYSSEKGTSHFLRCFCQSNAALAYLRVINGKGACHTGFVLGTAKLAPQAAHTIPRLELGAAVLAAELAETIINELDFSLDAVEFYTDSRVVLGYIYNQTRCFYVYVANRVQCIRKVSSPTQWHYVSTKHNPADHATHSV